MWSIAVSCAEAVLIRSKLTYFYAPFVYIKHGGPFCKFLGETILASIFLKKTDFIYKGHSNSVEHLMIEAVLRG